MKHNVLVVGLGKIGLGFDLSSDSCYILTHTKAYLRHKDFNLIAGIDINMSRRKEFKDYTGKMAYSDIRQFKKYNNTKIDIVSLCTPEKVRYSEFIKIVSLKPKLVIIEKPLALTPSEAVKIKSTADKNNIKIFVNYTRRVDPSFENLRKILRAKKLGNVSLVKINYNGGMYKNASHFIDLIVHYFGVPKKIRCLNIKKRKDGDFDASFILRYKNFEAFFNYVPAAAYFIAETDIFLSKGRISVFDGGIDIKVLKAVRDPVFRSCFALKEIPLGIAHQPYRCQLNVLYHIAKALKNNKPLASTAKSGLDTLKICKKIEHEF